jgi:DNA-binding MarR family transcriptional regulator
VSPLKTDPIAEARQHWDRNWPGSPGIHMEAVTSIMRVQQILLGRLNELLRPFGLTFSRYEALMLLSFTRTGSLPLAKVGDRLQVHRTSVTNTIDKLEADGLVRRVPHWQDRRAILAQITSRGRDTARRATELLNAERFSVSELDEGNARQLTDILRTLRLAAGDFAASQAADPVETSPPPAP